MKALLQITGGIILCLIIAFFPLEYTIIKNVATDGWHIRYVVIEQNVELAQIVDNTYYIDTTLWTTNIAGFNRTIEYSGFKCVSPDKIEETKQIHMKEATETKIKLEKILYGE